MFLYFLSTTISKEKTVLIEIVNQKKMLLALQQKQKKSFTKKLIYLIYYLNKICKNLFSVTNHLKFVLKYYIYLCIFYFFYFLLNNKQLIRFL